MFATMHHAASILVSFVLVLFACRQSNAVAFELRDGGTYSLQLAVEDTCFLSYQNRTCGRVTPVVRKTTGLWNKWRLQVVDKEEGIVTLRSKDYGFCPDAVLSRLESTDCATPPVVMDPNLSGASGELTRFQLVPLPEDLYHVVAVGREGSTCARFLGAPGCGKFVEGGLGGEGE